MPGFFDLHVHLPQLSMTASAGYSLLPWLGQFVYETEAQFANETVARYRGEEFLDALIAAGTTTAAIYMTIHKKPGVDLEGCLIFFPQERHFWRFVQGLLRNYCFQIPSKTIFAGKRLSWSMPLPLKRMRILIGKVGMDRCRYSSFYPGKTDPPLCDTAEDFYLESAQLIEMFREKQQDPKVKSRALRQVTSDHVPSIALLFACGFRQNPESCRAFIDSPVVVLYILSLTVCICLARRMSCGTSNSQSCMFWNYDSSSVCR